MNLRSSGHPLDHIRVWSPAQDGVWKFSLSHGSFVTIWVSARRQDSTLVCWQLYISLAGLTPSFITQSWWKNFSQELDNGTYKTPHMCKVFKDVYCSKQNVHHLKYLLLTEQNELLLVNPTWIEQLACLFAVCFSTVWSGVKTACIHVSRLTSSNKCWESL